MTMTTEELKEILANHKHWLNEDCDGWENMRADFRGADLSGADLSGADLSHADLSGADLSNTVLRDASLRGADIRRAVLRGADLRGAVLIYANLRGADLSGTDLSDVYLGGADLRDADLSGAKNVPFIPYVCPDFGSFVGYKKASGFIVELEVPEDAKRLSGTSRMCRCDKAKVLRILNSDRTVATVTEVSSYRDSRFVYKVGEMVSVEDFDENRWRKHSTGIHFFINFQEAVNY